MNVTLTRLILITAILLPVAAPAAARNAVQAPEVSPAPVVAATVAQAATVSLAPAAAPGQAISPAPTPIAPPADNATPAQAVAHAPPIASPTVAAVQTVDNPYGLAALWAQGDFIARGTLLALVIMSAASWYVLVTKLWEQSWLLHQARKANRSFWKFPSVEAGVAALPVGSAFYSVAAAGLEAVDHHGGSLVENIDLNTWVSQSIQRAADQIVNRLQGGLVVLATVGSTAPFIGLFGTVWGIYHALTAIGIAGQASIDKVAGPVGEALIMTAIGLAVAVPAVLGYNWLVRRNKVAIEQVRNFGSDLHSVLLGGVRLPAQARAVAGVGKLLVRAA